MNYDKFIEEYGNQEVQFLNYYRFGFVLGNDVLHIGIGGNADKIRKIEIEANKKYKVKDFNVSCASIGDEFYDFEW